MTHPAYIHLTPPQTDYNLSCALNAPIKTVEEQGPEALKKKADRKYWRQQRDARKRAWRNEK